MILRDRWQWCGALEVLVAGVGRRGVGGRCRCIDAGVDRLREHEARSEDEQDDDGESQRHMNPAPSVTPVCGQYCSRISGRAVSASSVPVLSMHPVY